MRNATQFRINRVLILCTLCAAHLAFATISIDTVTVGNVGNGPDPLTGIGQVNYSYRIAKYEVTCAQYAAFLNAVAGIDTYEAYDPGMGQSVFGSSISRNGGGIPANPYTYSAAADYANRPVIFVTFTRACRFVNWLHNGQPTGLEGPGTTETGTYTLTSDGIANNTVTRNPGSTWAITSENEWYKAAYHKNDGVTNHYFLYPTSSDTPPGRSLSDPVGNNANWGGVDPPLDSTHHTTPVGQFQNSASPYGTFDQGGNLVEFNELINGGSRGIRGGDFDSDVHDLRSDEEGFITFGSPTAGSYFDGFRVVQIPEPVSSALVAWGVIWILASCRRIRVIRVQSITPPAAQSHSPSHASRYG